MPPRICSAFRWNVIGYLTLYACIKQTLALALDMMELIFFTIHKMIIWLDSKLIFCICQGI
jgi:hypothetical protein